MESEVQISGKDFMKWFDGWRADGYYWDNDVSMVGAADPLHDVDGNWKLDPESVYNVDWLGYIAKEDVALPDLDTHSVLTRWLARKGKEVVTVLVPKDDVKAVETAVKGVRGKILKPKAAAGEFTGIDFMDWWDRAFPEGHFFDLDGEDLHDGNGVWKMDPELSYDIAKMGSLQKESDPEAGLDVEIVIRQHIKSRTEVPMIVLVAPEHVEAVKALGLPVAPPREPEEAPSPGF
jgi:hypothetical protein